MKKSNEEKILEEMKKLSSINLPAKSAGLHYSTGITKTELNRSLNKLIDQGRIVRTGRHVHTRYELAPEKEGLAQAIQDLPGKFKTEHKLDGGAPLDLDPKTEAEIQECLRRFREANKNFDPRKTMKKKIKGKTREEFIAWLEEVLIPDLRESGSDPTAETFETCIKWIKKGE